MTQGIEMKPIMKVTEPDNIKAKEIPKINKQKL